MKVSEGRRPSKYARATLVVSAVKKRSRVMQGKVTKVVRASLTRVIARLR